MSKASSRKEGTARFAYDGLDRVIHERARLSILTSLLTHPKGLLFGDLKQLCGLTDGNLSRHLQVLEEAGRRGFMFEMMETSFFVSRETLIPRVSPGR